ncbi:MAG: hypothetical protein JOZ88_06315 [Hyphomicrobiales bacterium]|nr:hypothetical protein [Hyphomicrobiales bacterium]
MSTSKRKNGVDLDELSKKPADFKVVESEVAVNVGSGNYERRIYCLTKQELFAMLKRVEADKSLVNEILRYNDAAAKEIEGGAIDASQELRQKLFDISKQIREHFCIDDKSRVEAIKIKAVGLVISYIVANNENSQNQQ